MTCPDIPAQARIRSRTVLVFCYCLAFAVGLGTVWLVVQLSFAPAFSADDTGTLLLYLAPITGLAVFQLVLGLTCRLWRGWQFWVAGPWLVYGTLTAAILAAQYGGYIGTVAAIYVAAAVVFLIGLVVVLRTKPAPGDAGRPASP